MALAAPRRAKEVDDGVLECEIGIFGGRRGGERERALESCFFCLRLCDRSELEDEDDEYFPGIDVRG